MYTGDLDQGGGEVLSSSNLAEYLCEIGHCSSPVNFYPRFLPATPTYTINYFFLKYRLNIMHDMHFLLPLDENRHK